MTKQSPPPPTPEGASALPRFVQRRVDGYFIERVAGSWSGGHIMRGARPGPGAIQLQSNDYLALGSHPAIIEAQCEALRCAGNGQQMSQVFLNGPGAQSMVEHQLAVLLRSGTSVLAQSGYAANLALLQSIADASTPVHIDMAAHASLWEGVRAAGATAVAFRHNDPAHLRRRVREHGPGVIVVDSVYSVDGTVAPLADIAQVARDTNSVLVVDESHSLGTHGPGGAGLVVDLGLTDAVAFRTASLAKAFCSRAGVIACHPRFAEYMRYEANVLIFSSTLLPHEAVGIAKTLEVIGQEQWRRDQLHSNAAWLRCQLRELGYQVASQSQIVSLESGSEGDTIVLRDAIESRGLFGAPFCAPATPKNRACIRFSVHAALTREELVRIRDICAEIREEVDMQSWPSTRRAARAPAPPALRAASSTAHALSA